MEKILVVDDDVDFTEMLCDQLGRLGYEALQANYLADGLKKADKQVPGVVLLDVQMPDGDGLEFIPRFKNAGNSPEVIIITGNGDPDGAELAIKSGAWGYIEKPDVISEIKLNISRVLAYRAEKEKARAKEIFLKNTNIIGSSRPLLSCLNQIASYAISDINILLKGETGVGKELFARAIHENSPRSRNNFVIVDCASLPETLAESILFGHEKGAFTGAEKNYPGLLSQAHNGTLFLDEVGELNPDMQKKFLRALQEHRYRPVGGKLEERSNFRLIAATNRDLKKMTGTGRFREDLLFRLDAAAIILPPLRNRLEDIDALVLHYFTRITERYGISQKGFSPDFLLALKSYSWPGNVRELINTLEVAINNAFHEPIVYARHLPENIRIHSVRMAVASEKSTVKPPPNAVAAENAPLPSYKEYRDNVLQAAERQYLHKLMKEARGSIKEACRLAGLGRTRLYNLMKKHGISRFGSF